MRMRIALTVLAKKWWKVMASSDCQVYQTDRTDGSFPLPSLNLTFQWVRGSRLHNVGREKIVVRIFPWEAVHIGVFPKDLPF